jgi:four helix bundle protein
VAKDVFLLSVSHWTPPAGAAFSQLQRAALSVSLNIAEGYAIRSQRRWVFHLRVAYGSAVETTDILSLISEIQAVPGRLVDPVLARSKRTQSLVLGLLHAAE